jgi:hydrogenase nickel incorporation protein HypA/HybF
MHELSIAYNLVDIAVQAAQQAQAGSVDVVYLRLGKLSGVEKDALLFGYDIAVKGTILQGSRLEVEDVPVTVYCPVCDATSELPDIQLFCCPQCGTPTGDIRQGKELEIVSLEIEDEQPTYS